MTRSARIVVHRPPDPFHSTISAALAAKNPPPKPNATAREIERKRKAAIRSLERVLKMLKEQNHG